MLQGIIFISFICSSGRCGIFSSSSSQTHSAELTVQAAFFSACFFCTLSPRAARYHFHLPYLFFRQMWQLLWKYSSSGRRVLESSAR
ncbi:hypothetical protein ACFX2A_015111 [Malus domestica]